MAIKISTGFSIGSKDLIDDRLVLTKDQMLNINEAIYPDHFFSLCSDDNQIYVFDINNDVLDPEVGKFKLYSSGEGGITIDDVTPSTSTVYSSQKIEDKIGKVGNGEVSSTGLYKYIDEKVGNGSITEDIEVIGVGEIGGYKDGDVISKDTDTITSVLKQLLRKVIHPTYIAPTLTVTVSPSILEVGVESAITVTPKFTQNDAGLVNTYQGYRNDTALSQDESRLEKTVFNYTPTDTTSIFYKYEITYHEGITKQNNFGESDTTGKIMDGSLTKTSSLISVVYPTFYGATDIVPTTSNEITALTKLVRVKNDLAQLFTVDNKYIVYAYPSSFGDLTSIIDSNGFENITDFTKTTIEVTTTTGYNTTYNVYTTNSKKTVDNFKFTFKF